MKSTVKYIFIEIFFTFFFSNQTMEKEAAPNKAQGPLEGNV